MLCLVAYSDSCGEYGCIYYNKHYLGWEKNGIARMLAFLAIQGFMYFTLLLFIESNQFQKIINFLRCNTESNLVEKDPVGETTPLLYDSSPENARSRPRTYSHSCVQEDTDVATERARLANTQIQELCDSDSLILHEVTKYYGSSSYLAVNHISVGIPQGECFGLLGINGAGKTTTFKMLTGDEIMTSGEAYLDGYSIRNNISQV